MVLQGFYKSTKNIQDGKVRKREAKTETTSKIPLPKRQYQCGNGFVGVESDGNMISKCWYFIGFKRFCVKQTVGQGKNFLRVGEGAGGRFGPHGDSLTSAFGSSGKAFVECDREEFAT